MELQSPPFCVFPVLWGIESTPAYLRSSVSRVEYIKILPSFGSPQSESNLETVCTDVGKRKKFNLLIIYEACTAGKVQIQKRRAEEGPIISHPTY